MKTLLRCVIPILGLLTTGCHVHSGTVNADSAKQIDKHQAQGHAHTKAADASLSAQDFFEKREALIIKHSHTDPTFAAMQNETSFSPEYWRLRVDQYLYGQYPEYQAIYDAYTQGKSFTQIYDLPEEDLGPKFVVPTKLPAIPEGYFTGNMHGNSHTGWHTIEDEKLYITYQGHRTDPYVAVYDLNDKTWKGPFKAGVSDLSKGDRKLDSHGRPVIEVDSRGHIHIIFGGHGGEREDGLNPLSIDTPHAGGRMKHVMSVRPHDISEFVEVNDIKPFASYAKSYKMANGDIYFFTRAGTHKSPWLYYQMKHGSQRFEEPVIISWPTIQKDNPILVDTFYINPVKVADNEIVISSLWHACNFKEEHDRTHYNRLNAYYMKLNTDDDSFYNIEGKQLSLPITLASANKYTLAYDSEKAGETSFGTRPLVRENGDHALAYEARGEGYREWRMARYDEGKWSHGHPMPGTQNRVLIDENGSKLKAIQSLIPLASKQANQQAAVIYKSKSGENKVAIAKRLSNSNSELEQWQVEQVYFSVTKARLQMQEVNDASGNAIAVVLNIRKGNSQRLYLWHDGQFRKNH